MPTTTSEIRVAFRGGGGGTGELTWGQMRVWRTSRLTGRTMNLAVFMRMPAGTPLSEMADLLRFLVVRHPALRTRLEFGAGRTGADHPRQVVAESGDVPLEILDIHDDATDAEVFAEADVLRARYERTWFDYEHDFPVRMGVIRRAGSVAYMVVGYSHVMIDGAGILAMVADLPNLDKATGEATAAAPDFSPLSLAETQGSETGKRQTDKCLRYWAGQIDRLPDWQVAQRGASAVSGAGSAAGLPAASAGASRAGSPAGPAASPENAEPRYWQLIGFSPALELGLRMIAERTGLDSTYVLLAAYSVAVSRVWGRTPNAVQIVVSNRFRPGLADAATQLSQHGICVVDAADATFDEVVRRAFRATTNASKHGYYDTVALDDLLEQTEAELGRPLDLDWHLNDRRAMFGTEEADAKLVGVDVRAAILEAVKHTKLLWHRKLPTSDGTLFLHVDARRTEKVLDHLAATVPWPAAYPQVWVDTHHFAPDDVVAFVLELEGVVVEAATNAEARTGVTKAEG